MCMRYSIHERSATCMNCFKMWFYLFTATVHISQTVRHYLYYTLPNRQIGLNEPMSWPARSPDISPLDFYLWGHIKSSIYETLVESEIDFIARIAVATGQIAENPWAFKHVRQSILKSVPDLYWRRGQHFEQLL